MTLDLVGIMLPQCLQMTEAHRETRMLVQEVSMASYMAFVLDLGIRGQVKRHAQTSSQISKVTELR